MINNRYIKLFFVACSSLAIVMACKKNTLTVSPYEYTDGQALFKINYSSPYAKNPAVQLRINGIKVSNGITYSTPFPGGGLNTGGSNNADYLGIPAGSNEVSLSIVKVGTNEDSIVLYKTPVEVIANAYQTLHITDTAAATTSVLLQDASSKADSGVAKYRFINLIPNSNLDLYAGTVKVASNIAYKAVTDTFSAAAGSNPVWSLRLAGSGTTLGTTYQNTGTTTNQRVFTIYSRGYVAPATSDIRSAKISFVYNK